MIHEECSEREEMTLPGVQFLWFLRNLRNLQIKEKSEMEETFSYSGKFAS
jgi:hypothetical protein